MKRQFIAGLFLLGLFVAGGVFLVLRSSSHGGPGAVIVGNDSGATYSYDITPGTFDALAHGESISVLPNVLNLRVGDTVRIRNDDSQSGVVGPFYVDAHGVVTQKFTSPGTYNGLCTVHPDGKIEIHVIK